MGRTLRKRGRRPQNLVSTQQIEQLYAWIQKLGYRPKCPLRLAETPASGRGLICLRNISAYDVIIDLPPSLLITPKVVRSMYGLKRDSFSAEEILTVFVIAEKLLGAESKWKPYIDSIPEKFDGLHSRRGVEGLPARLRSAVEKWNLGARKSFSRLQQYFSKKGVQLTLETFDWAWCAVNTRCIYVEGHGSTLAPFLDLLNHHWKAGVETSFVDNHFIIRSKDNYKAGEEVFISYGSHDNRTLFLNYGFVLDNNPNDCVTVELYHLEKLHQMEEIPRFTEKISFLCQHDKLTEQTGFTNEGATWNLEVVLQILREDDREEWKKILIHEAPCDVSRLRKVLATVMLEDYGATMANDLMRQRLIDIETGILHRVINDDLIGGVT